MSYQHEDEWVTVTVMVHDEHGNLVPVDVDGEEFWYECNTCFAAAGMPCITGEEN